MKAPSIEDKVPWTRDAVWAYYPDEPRCWTDAEIEGQVFVDTKRCVGGPAPPWKPITIGPVAIDPLASLLDAAVRLLESQGYTVIPPGGR